MIEFSKIDYNLDEIEEVAQLSKLKTGCDYKIYGLKEDDKNPPILIEFNYGLFNTVTDNDRNNLIKFFKFNDMLLSFSNDEKTTQHQIWIGLRKDLREDVVISAGCLKTIILSLEGKLDLESKFKVPGMPLPRNRK